MDGGAEGLPCLADLVNLKSLDIESLRALPDVNHLVSLSTLRLHDCGELKLTVHEMEKLETMWPGLEWEWTRVILIMDPEHDDERDGKRLKLVDTI